MPSDFSGITSNKDFAVTTAYTLYLKQVGEVSDLANRTGNFRSAIIRDAIDFYYGFLNNPEVTRIYEQTGIDKAALFEQAIALLDAKYEVPE